KAMAKDPAARFQTAEEFRERLEALHGVSQLVSSAPVVAAPVVIATPPPQPVGTPVSVPSPQPPIAALAAAIIAPPQPQLQTPAQPDGDQPAETEEITEAALEAHRAVPGWNPWVLFAASLFTFLVAIWGLLLIFRRF